MDSRDDLKSIKRWAEKKGISCKLIALHKLIPEEDPEKAYFLVLRGGASLFVDLDALTKEQEALTKDTKALMYGQVRNKKARHNLCFAEEAQEPEYEKGKGTVVAFKDVPLLEKLRQGVGEMCPSGRTQNLLCEANYYYDLAQCYIGFHGDAERRRVVGIRLGLSMPLHYQWYRMSKPVVKRYEMLLHHGDVYVMSAKAVGYDWTADRKGLTLRHAAGFPETLRKAKVHLEEKHK